MRVSPIYAISIGVFAFTAVEFVAWLIHALAPAPDAPAIIALIGLMGILLLSGPGFIAGALTKHSPVLTGFVVGVSCVLVDVLLSITLGGLTLEIFLARVELAHVLIQIVTSTLMAAVGFYLRKHLE